MKVIGEKIACFSNYFRDSTNIKYESVKVDR